MKPGDCGKLVLNSPGYGLFAYVPHTTNDYKQGIPATFQLERNQTFTIISLIHDEQNTSGFGNDWAFIIVDGTTKTGWIQAHYVKRM